MTASTLFAVSPIGLLGYAIVIAVIAYVVWRILPQSLREKIGLTVGIKVNASVDSMTTKIERAEANLDRLVNEVATEERKLSDSKGTRNHEANKLTTLKSEQTQLENDWNLAVDNSMPANVVDELKLNYETKSAEVKSQQDVVDAHNLAVNASRGAIDTAQKEIKKLQSTLKTKAAQDKATQAMGTAARVLEETKGIGSKAGSIAKDLDGVDEDYEKAKERLKDATTGANGGQSQQAMDELKAKLKSQNPSADPNSLEARRAARAAANKPAGQ